MSKRIVILCDGTWNKEESNTNIEWLHKNLANVAGEQVVHYQAGVGSQWYNRLSGGALGAGLARDVRDTYDMLLKDYQSGDEVFVFGFSRGAFTARSLCGFVRQVGKLADPADIDEAFFYYRINEPGQEPNFVERLFKPKSAGPIPIRFLGVFDTVGSLGVPFEIADTPETLASESWLDRARGRLRQIVDRGGDAIKKPITGFHDTTLSGHVEEAYQALAIDEERATFVPTLWTAAPGKAFRLEGGQRREVDQKVEQVWFAGVHSDIGGGYDEMPEPVRLSNIALLWMAEKARAAGLRFKPGSIETVRDNARAAATLPQHDSNTAIWNTVHKLIKKPAVRRPMTNARRKEVNPAGDIFPPVEHAAWLTEAVHYSVARRLGTNVQVHSADHPHQPTPLDYDPPGLDRAMIQPEPGGR